MRALVVLASVCLLPLLGCSHQSATGREPDEYVGCGADEQWLLFDDSAPLVIVDDSRAPSLAPLPSPAPRGTLLVWSRSPGAAHVPLGDVPSDPATCPQWTLGALRPTHLPPLSGTVYDLQFGPAGAPIHRVITTLEQWAAPDALWQSWAGRTLEVRVTSLTLLRNEIKDGPFTGSKPTLFTVAP
jgi:hypothetical protein